MISTLQLDSMAVWDICWTSVMPHSGSSLDTNSIKKFALQSSIVADV